uniref:Uncharacterized protein n=1 Tax=Panagrolaimus sp. ES5 TaxID=591445 RepID=A0AC34GS49_9BILA
MIHFSIVGFNRKKHSNILNECDRISMNLFSSLKKLFFKLLYFFLVPVDSHTTGYISEWFNATIDKCDKRVLN